MNTIVKKIFFFLILVIICFLAYGYFSRNSVFIGNTSSKSCVEFRGRVDSKSNDNIRIIVSTLANTSTVGLSLKGNYLKKVGREVDEKVPCPLTFLAVIFADKELAKDMKEIKKSSFKYNRFCEGLYPNMIKLYRNQSCFKKQIYLFAKFLKINPEKTLTIADTCGKHGQDGDKDAFIPFVDYLIKQKNP